MTVHEQPQGALNNGVFGPFDACPRGRFAVGVRTRFSPYHGHLHVPGRRNMAIASVHLLCQDEHALQWSPTYIASNEV